MEEIPLTVSIGKLRVIVHGGYGEIGGNIIEVRCGDSSIVLDLGLSLARKNRIYSWPTFDVEDPGELFRLGIARRVEGLYTSWTGPYNPSEGSETHILAAFISHAHADHVYMLPQLNRSITAYMGETAAIIYRARREASRRRRYWVDAGIEIRTFRSFQRIRVGEFTVTPVHVDHSIPGAYGFVVDTPEGSIAYTGDYRLHGTSESYDGRGSLTLDFVEEAARHDPLLLITEATRFEDVDLEHERDVEAKVASLLSSCRGTVLATFSETDVDRFRSFYRAAEAEGWRILIPLRHFKILHSLEKMDRRLGLRLDRDLVTPYYRGKERLEKWERDVIEEASKDGFEVASFPEDAGRLRGAIVLGFDAVRREIMRSGLPRGSMAILSHSEPADEEGEVELEKLLNWLRNYSIPSYRIHCSGHIYMKDLARVVDEVRPRDVLVVHSEHPDVIKRYLGFG